MASSTITKSLASDVASLNDSFTNYTYSEIAADSDLNNFMDPGFYGSISAARSENIAHSPITSTGYSLLVMRYGSFRIQFAMGSGAYIFARRYTTANGWTAWYRFAGTEQA